MSFKDNCVFQGGNQSYSNQNKINKVELNKSDTALIIGTLVILC